MGSARGWRYGRGCTCRNLEYAVYCGSPSSAQGIFTFRGALQRHCPRRPKPLGSSSANGADVGSGDAIKSSIAI